MLKNSDPLPENINPIYSCGLSGLLLGLSVPSFSYAPLGFLAWIWLVPLLFELRRTEKFLPFFGRVLIAVGIGFSMITLWVVNASILGFLTSVLMGTFVWTLPFVWFYLVRRFLNRQIALVSLPFFWTAWEWLYHLTPFSFGALRQGYLQADLLWLIQFADLTGIEGVTFWVVLVNVLMFLTLERRKGEEKRRRKGENVHFAGLLFSPASLILFALFALPIAYSIFVFSKPQPTEKEISVAAVQPNISPLADYSDENLPEIFGKQLALTDKALKTDAPDLIIWNEAAVPFVLSEDIAANEYLAKQLKKWNAPLLTGLIEVKNYATDEPRPPLLVAQKRDQEFFNAAALFQPAVQNGNLPIELSELYLKRRLMPFLEHVPFSDRFPFLADLIIPIGTRPRLSYGEKPVTFDFQTRGGAHVRVGAMICYENLYPEMSADAVRSGGAQVLAAITNEGFFAGSQGQYQLAAFSRFRSIETRRAVVRVAATGMTRATDKFGRVTAEVPAWSEQIMRTKVFLSDEQTFYVRFGDWLPILCLLAVGLMIVFATVNLSVAKLLDKNRLLTNRRRGGKYASTVPIAAMRIFNLHYKR